MFRLLFTTSWPLVSVMVCPLSDESKLIVSPSFASASAWRNEPAPLSFVLITVNVAAFTSCTLPTAAHSSAKSKRIRGLRSKVGFFISLLFVFVPLQRKKIRSVSETRKIFKGTTDDTDIADNGDED